MNAILDIETTGGKFNEEGITEIAIYRYDGQKVVDQLSSLVNPLREIQPFVERLTGINSKMLVNAPKFFELAKRIVEITEGCVLVAHNAEFDYRILQTEFRRLGFAFESKSLCTVALSQKLLPEAESYKLGNLVRSLGIPITDRHRAHGDALATLELFKLLLEKDSEKEIISTYIKELNKNKVPVKFLNVIEELPSEIGVYYIHDSEGNIIYIGKSKNIKKRVLNHLTGSNSKAVKIQKKLARVSYELCGNECIALLKEQHEIKSNQPVLNHALKFRSFAMGIRLDTTTPYYRLIIEPVIHEDEYLDVFKNKKDANRKLRKWIEEFTLCESQTSLGNPNKACFGHGLKECNGACVGDESTSTYNKRVLKIHESLQYPHKNMLLIDKGNGNGKKSFVYIKNAVFQGYGYFKLNHQIKTIKAIEARLTPIENNRDTQALVRSFIRRKKYKKIIDLDTV
jgi:DNA polymerase-3 subunit epsilon